MISATPIFACYMAAALGAEAILGSDALEPWKPVIIFGAFLSGMPFGWVSADKVCDWLQHRRTRRRSKEEWR